jgi:hypothetical protein
MPREIRAFPVAGESGKAIGCNDINVSAISSLRDRAHDPGAGFLEGVQVRGESGGQMHRVTALPRMSERMRYPDELFPPLIRRIE